MKENAAEWKQSSTLSVGQPSEVTNARKTLGQHVLKKAAEKLFASESHRAFLVVILVIPPTEADLGFVDGKKPVIGDGHAMRITSQILQDMFWTAKRRLRIDHPVLLRQGCRRNVAKCLLIGQWQTLAMECQMLIVERRRRSPFANLSRNTAAEHLHGQEEIGS